MSLITKEEVGESVEYSKGPAWWPCYYCQLTKDKYTGRRNRYPGRKRPRVRRAYSGTDGPMLNSRRR